MHCGFSRRDCIKFIIFFQKTHFQFLEHKNGNWWSLYEHWLCTYFLLFSVNFILIQFQIHRKITSIVCVTPIIPFTWFTNCLQFTPFTLSLSLFHQFFLIIWEKVGDITLFLIYPAYFLRANTFSYMTTAHYSKSGKITFNTVEYYYLIHNQSLNFNNCFNNIL